MSLLVNPKLLKSASVAAMCIAAISVHAAEPQMSTDAEVPGKSWFKSSDKGFSYFLGLGHQGLKYRENAKLLPVKSSVKTSSPIFVTGALYAVNDDLLFSVDSEGTFYPKRATESWNSTAPVFNGVILTDSLLQENRFALSQNHTQILGHYRLSGANFLIAGPAVHTQSFKRFSFKIGPDKAVTTPKDTVVEESSGEIILNVGWALESEQVRGKDAHYGLRAVVGVPIWRRVDNTNVPDVQFTNARGYDLLLEGRYSYAIHSGVHFGLWGKMLTSRRERESLPRLNGDTAELPNSRLDSMSYGIEFLWKL
jgi:hypothetical protein